MKEYLLFICQWLSLLSIKAAGLGVPGTDKQDQFIKEVTLKSNVFNNTRAIRILLPPDYFKKENESTRYAVLFMNDGIAVFHAYNIKKITHGLINSKKIIPLIIVGIDNGGSTKESTNPVRDRANEYLPWPDIEDRDSLTILDNPMGKLYPSFLLNEVIPLIESKFRIDTMNMCLGGSSRGGLIALYTTLAKPGKFRGILLESPSLYVFNKQGLTESSLCKIWPEKIYMGIGTKEGKTKETQDMVVSDVERLNDIIKINSPATKRKYLLEKNARHEFVFFAKRFPVALLFLFERQIQ